MQMKKKLKEYVSPTIKSQEILLEVGLAQSSNIINPGNQSGTVQVYDWDALDNGNDLIISEPGNSSWQ